MAQAYVQVKESKDYVNCFNVATLYIQTLVSTQTWVLLNVSQH